MLASASWTGGQEGHHLQQGDSPPSKPETREHCNVECSFLFQYSDILQGHLTIYIVLHRK